MVVDVSALPLTISDEVGGNGTGGGTCCVTTFCSRPIATALLLSPTAKAGVVPVGRAAATWLAVSVGLTAMVVASVPLKKFRPLLPSMPTPAECTPLTD